MQHRSLVLASASPRRAELLQQIAVEFTVRPVDIDESALGDETPAAQVTRLASAKALAAKDAGTLAADSVVLASDTMVVIDDIALGKPRDQAHCLAMLTSLSGRTHQVLTAVSVIDANREATILVSTDVHFASLQPAQISAYWATGEPADKAGGYGIQGIGGQFVRSINGSYSAVVGLPLCETVQLLKDFEVMS